MMRVAQVIGKLAAAGVEAVVNNYYRAIDATRFQFDYFIDEDSTCEPPGEMLARGARYFRIPPTSRAAARVRTLTRLFRENGYDIVHAHMNTLNAPVLLAAWLAGTPVRISHNHSTSDPSEGRRATLKRLLRPTAGWWATDRFACGELAAAWMFGERAVRRGEVTILPNAIDVERFRFDPSAREAVRTQLGLEGRLVVGHVGRFMHQKNHAFLLEIFGALRERRRDAVLMLVGDGELRNEVEKCAREQGLAPYVRFMGIRKDTARLYSAMDVFVLPSFYEGLPVVGVEAQAAGLPCVFSKSVDPQAAVGGQVRFLALSQGAAAWARAVEESAQHAQARAQAADSVRRHGFDIGDTGEKLSALYEAFAGRRERRRKDD